MKKHILILSFTFFLFLSLIIQLTTYAQSLENKDVNLTNEANISNDETSQTSLAGLTDLNCRYGTAGFNTHMLSWLPTLGTGWYVNFSTTSPVNSDSEYVHIIRVNQQKSGNVYQNGFYTNPSLSQGGLGAQVDANLGDLWLVGNEPDVGPGQDDIYPAMYARAYHDTYHFIKQRDPSAQVAIAGLSMATPGRLQYLDIVWDTYINLYGTPLPVDVWNTHIYILSEYNPGIGSGDGRLALGTDPAIAKNWPITGNPSAECPLNNVICRAEHDSIPIFQEQLIATRQWMKDHGLQNKPLLLSEYGSLYPYVQENGGCFLSDEFGNCFTPTRVNNYMNATINWLKTSTNPNLGMPADNNRLVQQWLWFSLLVGSEESGASSNMLKENYQSYSAGNPAALTPIGQNYRNIIQAETRYVNLHATNASTVVGETILPSTTATVTIALDYHNNGNTAINQAFNVSFYADQNLTQLIGTQTINPVINGCARNTYTTSVQWANLSPGVHHYWAKVDSGNSISELESDNVASGIVLIDPESTYLPMITR